MRQRTWATWARTHRQACLCLERSAASGSRRGSSCDANVDTIATRDRFAIPVQNEGAACGSVDRCSPEYVAVLWPVIDGLCSYVDALAPQTIQSLVTLKRFSSLIMSQAEYCAEAHSHKHVVTPAVAALKGILGKQAV